MSDDLIQYFNENIKGFIDSNDPWIENSDLLNSKIIEAGRIIVRGSLYSPRKIQNTQTGEKGTLFQLKVEQNDNTPKDLWGKIIEILITTTVEQYFRYLEELKKPIDEITLVQIGQSRFQAVALTTTFTLRIDYKNAFNDQVVFYIGQTPKIAGRDLQSERPEQIKGPGDIRVFVRNTNGKFPGEDLFTGRLSTDVYFSIYIDGRPLAINHGFNGWEPSGKEWWYGPYSYK